MNERRRGSSEIAALKPKAQQHSERPDVLNIKQPRMHLKNDHIFLWLQILHVMLHIVCLTTLKWAELLAHARKTQEKSRKNRHLRTSRQYKPQSMMEEIQQKSGLYNKMFFLKICKDAASLGFCRRLQFQGGGAVRAQTQSSSFFSPDLGPATNPRSKDLRLLPKVRGLYWIQT